MLDSARRHRDALGFGRLRISGLKRLKHLRKAAGTLRRRERCRSHLRSSLRRRRDRCRFHVFFVRGSFRPKQRLEPVIFLRRWGLWGGYFAKNSGCAGWVIACRLIRAGELGIIKWRLGRVHAVHTVASKSMIDSGVQAYIAKS